mgnify:CR=1 FL=1
MNPVQILSAARTPIGKFGGWFASMTAADLGTVAAKAALERSGLPPAAVDELAAEIFLEGGDAPADRRVLDADLPGRAEKGSRLRQRQEMPEIVPVYMCEFLPNHCATIGNFHTQG